MFSLVLSFAPKERTYCHFPPKGRKNTYAGSDHYGSGYSPALLFRNTLLSPYQTNFESGDRSALPLIRATRVLRKVDIIF